MRRLAVWLSLLALAGCASESASVKLREQDIDALGTITFDRTPEQTFHAAQDALKVLGYTIAVADTATWTLTTARKRVHASASGGEASEVSRQYTLVMVQQRPGATRVVATPHVFVGDRDVSADPVWVFDGPEGERVQWKELFNQIREMLGL